METTKHKRRRILLLFSLGIGLPCLLLSYLAFRGIQNDQALLERETLNQHRRAADLITSSIHENIVEVEKSFYRFLDNLPELPQAIPPHLLDSLKNQHLLVEEFFFLENSGSVRFPGAKLLFVPDGSVKSEPDEIPASLFSKFMEQGQRYEFQQHDNQKALESYQQGLARLANPQMKGELLNAIARVQKKLTLFPAAIKTYQEMAQHYTQVRIKSGLPLGVAAHLELGALFLDRRDSLSAVQTSLGLYKHLVGGQWRLEKSQYEFAAVRTAELMHGIFSRAYLPSPLQSYHNTLRVLKEKEKVQKEVTVRLLAFQEKAPSRLSEKIAQSAANSRKTGNRFALEIDGQDYFVSLLNMSTKKDENSPEIFWGLLINANNLKAQLLPETIKEYVSSGKTGWVVLDKNGQIIAKSEESKTGAATVKAGFNEGFPPWSLELYQAQPHLLETLFSSRRSIYLYIFILIAVILVFGFVFTLRSVGHELEVAKMKSDFVSTISHEFKSPLTSVRQLAEMLQTGRVPSEARRQQYYDVIVEQSERLSILIDNVLDFARMEEGRRIFAYAIMDIAGLLREVVSRIQHQVQHTGFQLHAEIPEHLPPVRVDRIAIAQAVTNLIDNAIKFSGNGKHAEIQVFVENDHLVIAVHDYGIGIAKDEINKIFERFYRGGDQLTRTVKGAGLGLTLVKQIVQAHHGAIHVESEPGKGSTFTIRLPIADFGKMHRNPQSEIRNRKSEMGG
ncbi:MAG: HAMP domain-containing histidine kinase [candidate division KSB1 bacterium]|nr:HAMP domain-containing histidine kinase [candidate division KSB1 bacterium]MDZ7301184.1 HAMP domain-containing histidine kinase [candidate division KSB1 bacterium]MDZ7310592.1 HAMP domain-containing histidine kinase [candidate division KSB1 bacterium]